MRKVIASALICLTSIGVISAIHSEGAEATIGGCSATQITSGTMRARCTTVNNTPPLYSQWAYNTSCYILGIGWFNVTTGWHYASTTYYSASCNGTISTSGVFVFR